MASDNMRECLERDGFVLRKKLLTQLPTLDVAQRVGSILGFVDLATEPSQRRWVTILSCRNRPWYRLPLNASRAIFEFQDCLNFRRADLAMRLRRLPGRQ